jgi:nucleotide-binding universal stress UspA family protein
VFEIVLLATDASAEAERALAAARELAKVAGSEVRVLHVREAGSGFGRGAPLWGESPAEAVAIVEEAVAALQAEGVKASGAVRGSLSGLVAREILEEADEVHASLVMMGTRGLSDLAGLVVGSTTHKVLHLGNIPVLVVH